MAYLTRIGRGTAKIGLAALAVASYARGADLKYNHRWQNVPPEDFCEVDLVGTAKGANTFELYARDANGDKIGNSITLDLSDGKAARLNLRDAYGEEWRKQIVSVEGNSPLRSNAIMTCAAVVQPQTNAQSEVESEEETTAAAITQARGYIVPNQELATQRIDIFNNITIPASDDVDGTRLIRTKSSLMSAGYAGPQTQKYLMASTQQIDPVASIAHEHTGYLSMSTGNGTIVSLEEIIGKSAASNSSAGGLYLLDGSGTPVPNELNAYQMVEDEDGNKLPLYFPTEGASQRIILPHLEVPSGGNFVDGNWAIGYGLFNPSHKDAAVRLRFYDADGKQITAEPVPLHLKAGQPYVTFTHQALKNISGAENIKSAVLFSDQPIQAVQLFEYNRTHRVVVPAMTTLDLGRELVLPRALADAQSGVSHYTIYNPGELDETVIEEAYGFDGDLRFSSKQTLKPKQKWPANLVQMFDIPVDQANAIAYVKFKVVNPQPGKEDGTLIHNISDMTGKIGVLAINEEYRGPLRITGTNAQSLDQLKVMKQTSMFNPRTGMDVIEHNDPAQSIMFTVISNGEEPSTVDKAEWLPLATSNSTSFGATISPNPKDRILYGDALTKGSVKSQEFLINSRLPSTPYYPLIKLTRSTSGRSEGILLGDVLAVSAEGTYDINTIFGAGYSNKLVRENLTEFSNLIWRAKELGAPVGVSLPSLQLTFMEYTDGSNSNREIDTITSADIDNGIVFKLTLPDGSPFLWRIPIPNTPAGEQYMDELHQFLRVGPKHK
jgi:hypothetical protein